MTQHQRILLILRDAGSAGMNSYTWRMKFIQLPVRIKELKEKGYGIVSQTNKNRSVNYILTFDPDTKPIKSEQFSLI